ncbi:MAG: HAD-IIB family hydrolase [Fibrobacterales bacterium]
MKIMLINMHGLIRGHDLQIGKDADNGGQIRYVMDMAEALSEHPNVDKVYLFTRRMDDPKLSSDYNLAVENVNEKLEIRRIQCGGKKYRPKEQLWEFLDEFVTETIKHMKRYKVIPDWVHSHYGDAGYVAKELSTFLNIPFAHTGHSLGKHKYQKLIEEGFDHDLVMKKFKFEKRFEAENATLALSEFVVTSTQQEVGSYEDYNNFKLSNYTVIPPGINVEKYFPYYEYSLGNADISEEQKQAQFHIKEELEKFYTHKEKPIILALARPDRKKNLHALLEAYATDPQLKGMANLAIFAGIRLDIEEMPEGEKEVLTEILLMMDKYDLYGRLAIPKSHDANKEVPEIYRYCAMNKGVFVNPALVEPFGLTILEAASCGLPVVATQNGGPTEILANTGAGELVDPFDIASIQKGIKNLLFNESHWKQCSDNGVIKVREVYSWKAHIDRYLQLVQENLEASQGKGLKNIHISAAKSKKLMKTEKLFVTDIDGTLLLEEDGNPGLDDIKETINNRGTDFAFAVASGRSLSLIQDVFKKYELPTPDVLIGSVGTAIYYGFNPDSYDKGWHSYISKYWDREEIVRALKGVKWLELQEKEGQTPLKVSYIVDNTKYNEEDLKACLGKMWYQLNIIYSHEQFLDIIPKRASKGRAIRYLCQKWSISYNSVVASGDSGNDRDMFRGQTKGIIVSNYSPELGDMKSGKGKNIFFASKPAASGIIEGFKHFNFL